MFIDGGTRSTTRRGYTVEHERPVTRARETGRSPAPAVHAPAAARPEVRRAETPSAQHTRRLEADAARGAAPNAFRLAGSDLFGIDRAFGRARDAFAGVERRFAPFAGGASADRVEAQSARRLDPPTARRPAAAGPEPIGRRPRGEAARAEWYQRIVEQQGHQWRDGVNQVNVVGLRGYDVDHGRNRNRFGQWNDTMAFVWKGGDHRWHVREFRATTDPGMKSYADSPDVNRDGRGDVAWMRPGQYAYHVGTHKGGYGAGNPNRDVPVFRDTNHDGRISAGEERASQRRGDRGTGINLHWGPGYDNGEVGLYSLGCQVVTEDQGEFRQHITPIMERNRGRMLYTLVDASDVRWG